MSLKEEIGGIIYDADIYKAKVTTGQLNNIVDDIMKEIEKRINLIPPASSTQRYKSIKDINHVLPYITGYDDANEKIMELLK